MLKFIIFMALCSTAAACQSCSRNWDNQTPDNNKPDEYQDYRPYRQPNDYRATPSYYQPQQILPPPNRSWNGPPATPPPLRASYQRSTDHYNPYAYENYPQNYRP